MILAALIGFALAQTCTSGTQIATFNLCLKNQLTSPSGAIGPVTVDASCASVKDDQPTFYSCLCSRWTNAVGCYNQNCPQDVTLSSAVQSQKQFCDAAAANPQPIGPSGPVGNLPPLNSTTGTSPVVAGSPPKPSSSPSTTFTPGSNAALSPILSNIMIFGEFGVMLVLANVL